MDVRCERHTTAAGWHVPAEPTMLRLKSSFLGSRHPGPLRCPPRKRAARASYRAMQTHPLVDHAIVVGATTTLELDGATPRGSGVFECTYVPKVLFEYPPSRPLDAKVAVAAFCLPSALRLARVRRPPQFACFVLTLSDGSRMYGHCLTIHEPLGAATEVVLPPREVPAGWRECADGALVRLAEGEGETAPPAAAPPAGSTRKLLSELLHQGSACYAPRCIRSMSTGAACGCATARQPCLVARTSTVGSGAHSGVPASPLAAQMAGRGTATLGQ